MGVSTPRRYYFLKALELSRYDTDEALYRVYLGKKRSEPGTAIPPHFPARAALVSAGYEALEEIDGADEDELIFCGLSHSQATAVIAEFE